MTQAHVVTVSDRSADGSRPDAAGPAAVALLEAAGFSVTAEVIPDGAWVVERAISAAIAKGSRLIITSGGTGIGPRDRTPEGTAAVLDRDLPGVAELLRRHGEASLPHAALSRGLVGVIDGPPGALIANLPGKPAAVIEGLEVLLPLAGHILDQLDGGDH